MININEFLKQHQNEISEIISKLGKEFSSHHLIEKLSQQFESEYIAMLSKYKQNGKAFQKVNAQIAKYLSKNMKAFSVEKDHKGKSKTVFGTFDRIQWWKKI
jgi:hypothetical protein